MSEIETLEDAKEVIRASFKSGGTGCPCCGQFVKLYRRKITSSMAQGLISVYHYFKRPDAAEWLQVPSFLKSSTLCGDFSKLRYWDLVEPMPKQERPDGSKRAGYYRITEAGIAYAEGATIDQYRYEYNGHRRTIDDPDLTQHSIKDALGSKFNYAELMGMRWSNKWGAWVPRESVS